MDPEDTVAPVTPPPPPCRSRRPSPYPPCGVPVVRTRRRGCHLCQGTSDLPRLLSLTPSPGRVATVLSSPDTTYDQVTQCPPSKRSLCLGPISHTRAHVHTCTYLSQLPEWGSSAVSRTPVDVGPVTVRPSGTGNGRPGIGSFVLRGLRGGVPRSPTGHNGEVDLV